jgi:predicted dehydrogenase
VCVGLNRRSSPAVLELRRLVNKARDTAGGGAPSVDRTAGGQRTTIAERRQTQILVRINDDCRSWVDWVFAQEGGTLLAEMVHFINVALWLTPSPPVRVLAEGSSIGNYALIIRFEDGSLTTIHHSMAGHFDYPKELIEVCVNYVTLAMEHHVEVRQRGLTDEPFRHAYPFGEELDGTPLAGIDAFHEAVTRAVDAARASGDTPDFIEPDKGHAAHLDRFLDHVEGLGENPCDAADAVLATRIARKLLESQQRGTPAGITAADLSV